MWWWSDYSDDQLRDWYDGDHFNVMIVCWIWWQVIWWRSPLEGFPLWQDAHRDAAAVDEPEIVIMSLILMIMMIMMIKMRMQSMRSDRCWCWGGQESFLFNQAFGQTTFEVKMTIMMKLMMMVMMMIMMMRMKSYLSLQPSIRSNYQAGRTVLAPVAGAFTLTCNYYQQCHLQCKDTINQ